MSKILNKFPFVFQAILKQCQSYLSSELGEVYVHSLGNAIPRGINLALALIQESNDGYDYEATTSSQELIGWFIIYFSF